MSMKTTLQEVMANLQHVEDYDNRPSQDTRFTEAKSAIRALMEAPEPAPTIITQTLIENDTILAAIDAKLAEKLSGVTDAITGVNDNITGVSDKIDGMEDVLGEFVAQQSTPAPEAAPAPAPAA